MNRISEKLLQTPVQGVNLRPSTLAAQLDSEQPTLLVFLRHFG